MGYAALDRHAAKRRFAMTEGLGFEGEEFGLR